MIVKNRLRLSHLISNHCQDKITLEGELTSPFQRSLAFSRLAASPSRAGHKPAPYDQGGIPPWIPRRSAPRGKPRDISSDRQIVERSVFIKIIEGP